MESPKLSWTNDPAEARINRERLARVYDLASNWCESGEMPAATLVVGRSDVALRPRSFGRQTPGRATPLRGDAIFTVASITKPIVAMGILLLVERGVLTLGDKVGDLIPEFAGKGRYSIRLRHLLTHTSGLPDLLPQDRELRRANAPLSQFLGEICRVEPLFKPGRDVRYSSCAFVLLGEIAARTTGRPLPEFLHEEFFQPLGMHDTALGAPSDWFDGPQPRSGRFAAVRLPEEQADGDAWNWNSRYWQTLSAPWGGLLSTATDLAAFARMMLCDGGRQGESLLAPATIAAATSNQLIAMREVPESDRRCRPWGFGWRLHWPALGAYFGDLLSPSAYGHWGATGTLLWIDPDRDLFAVLLTTLPQDPDGRYLARLSNAVVAAIE